MGEEPVDPAQRPPAVTLREPSVIEEQDAIRAVPPEEKGADGSRAKNLETQPTVTTPV